MYKEIGRNLRTRRLDLGMTVEEVCAKLGISRSTWYRYEAGKVDSLTPMEITRIARALHIDSLKLLGFDDTFLESSFVTPQTEPVQVLPGPEKDPGQIAEEYAAMGVALHMAKPYPRALTDQDVDAIAKRVVSYNNQPVATAAPHTQEARTVSFGMDKLPEETRKRIVGMIRAMFSGTPEEEYFTEKGKTDDDA